MSSAPVVVVGGCLRLGVDALGEFVLIGVGALLGGIDDLGMGGDDGASMLVERNASKTRNRDGGGRDVEGPLMRGTRCPNKEAWTRP